ncbi:FxsA family protein [Streptacidiphilus sp. EB129]|uniref:FxsA family protein n=1 Tax=Streptacidiphilus sp. EB129 TaxID=3156262 RepID=UPI0035161170
MSQVHVDGGTGRPRPRGLRRFLPLLAAGWVLLELWLLLTVAGLIGWLATLGLLVGSVALGGWVIKRAGLRALRSTAAGMRGDPLTTEAGTAVTIVGGVLLIVPGLLSDVLGLACLFPPTAALLRRVPVRLLSRSGGPLGDAYRLQEQLRIHRPDGQVIVGEVVDPQPKPGTPDDPYGYGGRDPLTKG